jgi:hypothetical protein
MIEKYYIYILSLFKIATLKKILNLQERKKRKKKKKNLRDALKIQINIISPLLLERSRQDESNNIKKNYQ